VAREGLGDGDGAGAPVRRRKERQRLEAAASFGEGVNWVEAFSGGWRFSGCGFELLVRETAVCAVLVAPPGFFARVL
jgi:hypothetical protein